MRSETVAGTTTCPVIVETAKFAELDVPGNTIQLYTAGDGKTIAAALVNVAEVVKLKVVEICVILQKVAALFIMVGITNPKNCVESEPPEEVANPLLQPVITTSV